MPLDEGRGRLSGREDGAFTSGISILVKEAPGMAHLFSNASKRIVRRSHPGVCGPRSVNWPCLGIGLLSLTALRHKVVWFMQQSWRHFATAALVNWDCAIHEVLLSLQPMAAPLSLNSGSNYTTKCCPPNFPKMPLQMSWLLHGVMMGLNEWVDVNTTTIVPAYVLGGVRDARFPLNLFVTR